MRLNFLSNKIIGLIAILILAVGSASVIELTQVAKADQKGELCVFFACGNANITGGTSSRSGSRGGGGGGGQPTPTTGKLTVIKKMDCPSGCGQFVPKDFEIKVTKSDGSTESFPGSATGTEVTLPPGDYTISETPPPSNVFIFGNDFSGDCHRLDATADATGSIEAGEEQECTITNTFNP